MNAIEFQATIKNGIIEIPREYLEDLADRVRGILLVGEAPASTANLIDQLLAQPVRMKGFRPLTREEVHVR